MRRVVLVMMSVLMALVSQAQVEHSLGAQVGWDRQLYRLNSPSVSGKDKTELSKFALNGGRLGFVYELSDDSGFGLFTAFNYLLGWQSTPWELAPLTINGKQSMAPQYNQLYYRVQVESHSFDVNIQPQYKFEIAGHTYVTVYTGPSFQGIVKYSARDYYRQLDGTEVNPPVHVFGYNAEDMEAYYKRWNVTWGLGAAFQYDQYYIRGGYDFGLVNPYNVTAFGEVQVDVNGVPLPIFTQTDSNNPDDRVTRGRLDNWNVTLGVFFWQSDK